MRITVDRREEYVPDFDENMALGEDERVSFVFDRPLAYKRESWSRVVAGRDANGKLSTWLEKNTRQIILDSNVEVRNLSVVEDGRERQIRTGAELLEARGSLCAMLVTLLAARIVREDWKAELPS